MLFRSISVLNGADGLSEIAAGLVGQGLTILDSVKKSLSGSGGQAVTSYAPAPVTAGQVAEGAGVDGAGNGTGPVG